ncbi:complement C1q-like protein 4 [Lingula anatina]|uniref:Complement C1q-like protein 4 n=1 Tax=Lingula anatina TaxID=7574 RepID=A0A1S3IG59_LINAN|nr:complement C1q-like protein 4 [Lingula anatina]|eukprot:XP_013396459.1 complement C1q-like protein 4 [Lingula anatina]
MSSSAVLVILLVTMLEVCACSDLQRCTAAYKLVAFSAGRSNDLDQTGKGNAVVVYDTVFLNDGNGYNKDTGKFTSPTSGVYVFHYHSLSQNNKPVFVRLNHNGQIKNTGYGKPSTGHATGSNTIALRLAEEDEVWIDLVGGHALHNHPGEFHSTFTGYQLYPDNSSINTVAFH